MCRTVVFSHTILLIAEYGPFWWLIFELFDDDTRIAYSDAVGRDVFNDYASCSDCAAFTNRHPRKNCHTASYPTVITNSHWLGPFLSCIAFLRVSAMAGSIDAYIRSNEDIIADCYRRLIKNNEIEVSKEFLADLDMFPIVTMEWRVYECIVIGLPPGSASVSHSLPLSLWALSDCIPNIVQNKHTGPPEEKDPLRYKSHRRASFRILSYLLYLNAKIMIFCLYFN